MTSVKSRGITMTRTEVLALLDGRKTQHRVIIRPQPEVESGWEDQPDWALFWKGRDEGVAPEELALECPFGKPGGMVFVKEAFGWHAGQIVYRAGPHPVGKVDNLGLDGWHPSVHMTKDLSRFTLELTNLRVELAQEISERDAEAEGFQPGPIDDPMPPRDLGDGWTISSPGTWASSAGHFQVAWCERHGMDAWDVST